MNAGLDCEEQLVLWWGIVINKISRRLWRLVTVTLLISLIVVQVAGATTINAQALPAFPVIYYGTATIQGAPVDDGALVTARMGNRVYGPVVVKDGLFYNLAVNGDSSQNKEVITFYLQGVEPASEQKIYRYVNFPILPEEVKLTFSAMPLPTPVPTATPTVTPTPTATPQPTSTPITPPTPTQSPLSPMEVSIVIDANGTISRGEKGVLTIEAAPNGHRILRLEAIISADPRHIKILGSEPGSLLPRALSGQQVSGSAITVIIFQLDATPELYRSGSLVNVDFEVLRDGGSNEIKFELLALNVLNEDDNSIDIDVRDSSASAIVVGFPGDLNEDQTVDIVDLALFGRAFGTFERGRYYNHVADFNSDGAIDNLDLSTIVYFYDRGS